MYIRFFLFLKLILCFRPDDVNHVQIRCLPTSFMFLFFISLKQSLIFHSFYCCIIVRATSTSLSKKARLLLLMLITTKQIATTTEAEEEEDVEDGDHQLTEMSTVRNDPVGSDQGKHHQYLLTSISLAKERLKARRLKAGRRSQKIRPPAGTSQDGEDAAEMVSGELFFSLFLLKTLFFPPRFYLPNPPPPTLLYLLTASLTVRTNDHSELGWYIP